MKNKNSHVILQKYTQAQLYKESQYNHDSPMIFKMAAALTNYGQNQVHTTFGINVSDINKS